MVTNDYLINNRPIIKKFAVAIEEATKFIAENPEQAKLIATKYTALTLDLVEKTGIHFYVGPLSPLDKDKVQTVLNILSDGGILKQKINIQDMYFNP
jgi:ABC-type nitrate/sulfonate/bicarbonate transport system substrate-binding protein